MRIVVVEDDALIAKYLKYVLERDGGYAVVVTESGDEALQWARDSATVAVLVDISLRNTQLNGRHVDGLTLGRILKADEHASSVPFILATAHAMAGDRERFLRESGADAFIRKPIADPAELLSLVADLASRRQV